MVQDRVIRYVNGETLIATCTDNAFFTQVSCLCPSGRDPVQSLVRPILGGNCSALRHASDRDCQRGARPKPPSCRLIGSAAYGQLRLRMEGWRQRRLGSMGTI
jgi:hypothetical protein